MKASSYHILPEQCSVSSTNFLSTTELNRLALASAPPHASTAAITISAVKGQTDRRLTGKHSHLPLKRSSCSPISCQLTLHATEAAPPAEPKALSKALHHPTIFSHISMYFIAAAKMHDADEAEASEGSIAGADDEDEDEECTGCLSHPAFFSSLLHFQTVK
ncbi:uncharacterized protein MONOS_14300 [Monocercomonoides exilis]|uniref:uncharacterized protein n=1 Tax=Monocercomonoides exilis TaxID=2049356 RepID=UPI00355A09D9|nr:hypothetical protein MONOS_14300 [Monocercomonoides exilis]|eukprot:MONOS_14300.1-p1 / transcript=MONOS_14300.1 / gene=MONOS_14300 / organism=Monocercomonoides_exilis_PA203 / gene_product=unspecified product / transcript_product=unspecified product / location=Mono_scaffold00975:4865-5468(+) / protein_length=162 / sequence_SO=supercontig / SO=protein_coding / is_pseudo=false